MLGIFDSGLGGLTITKALRDMLPQERIIYVADQQFSPYGTKDAFEINQRAEAITQFLIAQGSSTVVIACNTATVAAIDSLRRQFPHTKFVGVEPAIKPAAQATHKGRIAILATSNTLQSHRLTQLTNKFAPHSQISLHALPRWVQLVEQGDIASRESSRQVRQDITAQNIHLAQAIVLACTHYPFLTPHIRQHAPGVTIFDPTLAVAQQVENIHTTDSRQPALSLYTTGDAQLASPAVTRLLGTPSKVESVTI